MNRRGKASLTVIMAVFISALILNVVTFAAKYNNQGMWVKGDLHTHSYLTDGNNTLEGTLSYAFGRFGLDWMANSEHGGIYSRDPYGNALEASVWRWQSLKDMSYPLVADMRKKYPQKMIIQGFEWNVPAHQHASVGIVSDEPKAISSFEYMFDEYDEDTSREKEGLVKNNSGHKGAVAGAKWLQDKYRYSSYISLNHPSKDLMYTAADIRDLNNAAPDVCFGFEGFPGHQKGVSRGNYEGGYGSYSYKAVTYGGVDYMAAKVGGLWDSLLGEGRRFWIFANSDFHGGVGDFWPGEFAKSYTFIKGNDYKSLVSGLGSGNSFAVTGDLINGLLYNIKYKDEIAGMGEKLVIGKGSDIEITIKFRSPGKNNNNDKVKVNHIDLIAGEVTGMIKPGAYNYNYDTNLSTKVVAGFTEKDWKTQFGWNTIRYKIKNVRKNMYFRLRGTNLGFNVKNETDVFGNPLNDKRMGENNAQKAYKDLWFYSNPIFVSIK